MIHVNMETEKLFLQQGSSCRCVQILMLKSYLNEKFDFQDLVLINRF